MREKLQQIVDAGWFRRAVTAVILLAGVLAGLETSATIRERYGVWLFGLDTLVLGVFVVELGLKIATHGRRPWLYFAEGWNVFDFAVVVLCCLPTDSAFAPVFRLARGLRLLRLVTALPKLQLLTGALLNSFGAMGYVGLLLALVFYIYGVAGVHLFGSEAPALFGSLSASLLTLFRLITLDNWSDLYAAVQAESPVAAPLFFVSFILLGTMVMLNLFIGVIMNSMSEMHQDLEMRGRSVAGREPCRRPAVDELRALERQLEVLHQQAVQLRNRLETSSLSR